MSESEHRYLQVLKEKHNQLKAAAESKSCGHSTHCMASYNMSAECNCGQDERINNYAKIWIELNILLEKII